LVLQGCIEWKKRSEDKYLEAYFGVLVEPLDRETRRFYVITVVHSNIGPGRFNLIRSGLFITWLYPGWPGRVLRGKMQDIKEG